MFENGKSWRTTVAGILAVLGGLGSFAQQYGIILPAWVTAVSGIILTLGIAFGFSQSKDKQVTGVPNAAKASDTAVTPTTLP